MLGSPNAASEMLVNLAKGVRGKREKERDFLGVNFINILRPHFSYKSDFFAKM